MSKCNALFNQEAEQIFYRIPIKDRDAKRKFVDQCLEVSMRVCSALFERDDALFLFSGAIAANEACPLYAYRIIKIKRGYDLKTTDEKLEFTKENCFLLLSLFLNTILLSDINNCFIKVFGQAIEKLKIDPPTPKKHFKTFLLDEGKYRETASRAAYNVLFESFVKQILFESSMKEPLNLELSELAKEDLKIKYPNFRNLSLYTYPIAGILIYLSKKIEEDGITLIIKIKIITQKGVEGVLVRKFGNAEGKAPVLVLSGIGTDGSFGIPNYRQKGQSCPNNYFRYEDPKRLHAKTEPCFFCKLNPESDTSLLNLFQQRVNQATEDFQTLFYALAVDSVLSDERFRPYFNREDKYPVLAEIFQTMQPKIHELGLSMEQPLAFSIVTAHVNSAEREESSGFYLDKVPKSHIETMD